MRRLTILVAVVLGCLTFAGCGTGQPTRTVTVNKAPTPTRQTTKTIHRAKIVHHKAKRPRIMYQRPETPSERTQEAANIPKAQTSPSNTTPHANPESSYSQAIRECNDNGSEAEGDCNRAWQENHTSSEDGIPAGTPGCHETTWHGMKVTEC